MSRNYWHGMLGKEIRLHPQMGLSNTLRRKSEEITRGLLRLATGKNRLVRAGDPTIIGSPTPLRNPLGLPWQPKIRMRIIAGVAERSSRSVYAAIGVSSFAQLMLRYKAIR